MAISTTSDWLVHIGPVVAVAPTTSTAYAALTPYTAIGEIESVGEFGDEATIVPFLSLTAGRKRKAKGSRDAGDFTITCARDPLDVGQVALKTAAGSAFQYALRITAADKADANDTNSIFYMTVLISSGRNVLGAADDMTKINFMVAVNSPIIEVPSVVVP